MASADTLKAEGNQAVKEKKFDLAVEKFTAAIALDPKNHVLYSNRSAAYASKKEWTEALADAEKTVEIKPDWARGWSRKGAALHGMGDLAGARSAYTEGLQIDPSNSQLRQSLEKTFLADTTGSSRDSAGSLRNMFGQLFHKPTMMAKLAANPKTAGFLADADFVAKLEQMAQNPQMMDASDPKITVALSVLLGIDATAGPTSPPDTATAGGDGAPPATEQAEPEPADNAAEKADEMEVDEEEAARRKAKVLADEQKALGTSLYKKREFDKAIEHYSKAWEMHKDIAYLNNLGAAHFEKGDYEECVRVCSQAVEEGREIYADFKMIAKSYARTGSAYQKMGDLDKAIEHYRKSLTEHRTPDVVTKLRSAERFKVDGARKAYIDPQKAEEAREEGNKKFKTQDWPGAVASYTEATKRAPDDPRGYSNRAAAFIKLLEFPSAVDDCDKAIEKDEKFVRAYIRKAQAYHGMREHSKSIDACTEAAKIDDKHHGGANSRDIEQARRKAMSAMFQARENETDEQTKERLMKDPEIIGIMQDPVMNAILQQAQTDPAALQEHMKNPDVRTKIQKLAAAGVLRVGP